jgi:thioesterase domain-containing protein
MKPIFGPQTQRLLAFLADLRDLSPAEVDRVTRAWKQARGLDRAEAWAQLQRVTTQHERYPILAAASTARRTAMDTARRLLRPDWAFWAAAWDAAAAIIADDRIGGHYKVLTAPLATVMPSLTHSRGSAGYAVRAPAPRLPAEPVRSRSGYP